MSVPSPFDRDIGSGAAAARGQDLEANPSLISFLASTSRSYHVGRGFPPLFSDAWELSEHIYEQYDTGL